MANGQKTKKVAESNENVSYLGQHLRGMDTGRVILPSEWRPEGSAREFMVMPWPLTTPECLLVLPPARWEFLQRHLEGLSLDGDEAAIIERLISSNTSKRSLDSYGRLPLPEEAAKALGIEKEALLVGRMNKFEVWNPARLEASTRTAVQAVEKTIKSIRV